MKWIAIDELPPDIEDFYCCRVGYSKATTQFGTGFFSAYLGRIVARDAFGEEFDPTHWSPLPEPPLAANTGVKPRAARTSA